MDEGDNGLPFRCDYAKSGASKCRACKAPIPKGDFRLAKLVKSAQFDGVIPAWYHADCFFQHSKKHGLDDPADVEGLGRVRPEDQRRVRAHFKGAESSEVASRVEESSALVWTIAETLKSAPLSCVSNWLNENGLEGSVRNPEEARERLASAIVYGVPPDCPDCATSGSVRRCASGYKCSHRGEWGPCGFESRDVQCLPFKADQTLKGQLPPEGLECLTQPRLWISTSGPDSRDRKRKAPEEDEEDADAEQRSGSVWTGVKIGGVHPGPAKDVLQLFGFQFHRTLAKTSDAFLLSKDMFTKARSTRAVLSEETIASLDFAGLQAALSTEASFLKLGHPDGGDGNEAKLKALWTKVHQASQKDAAAAPKKRKAEEDHGEAKTVKLVFKGRAAVDPAAGEHFVRDWRVSDPQGGEGPYDAVLNLADVSSGVNSFYGLQLLERDVPATSEADNFALFRKWGRIGSDRGSSKIEPFSSLSEALSRFEAIFKDKTGNDWRKHVRGEFSKQPGKFVPVSLVRALPEASDSALGTGDEERSHGLDERVASLMAKIFDVKAIEQSLREMEIDLKKMPLGNLSKATVEQGYSILKEIESFLRESPPAADPKEADVWKRVDQSAEELLRLLTESKGSLASLEAARKIRKEALDRRNGNEVAQRRRRSQLVALTNKFYTVVPHDFGEQAAPLLDNLEELSAKARLLDTLAEVEAVVSILKRGDDASAAVHPIRQKYDELRAELAPIGESDPRREIFEAQLQNQMGSRRVRLDHVYEVRREGEEERFLSLPGQRALLWHGSRLTNFGGILSRGLLIAPPSAPVSGYRLGKGVYFANVAEKSIGYAAPQTGRTILLLLCEVALGKPAELLDDRYMEKPLDGFDSTHALGTLTPSKVCQRPDLGLDLDLPVGEPQHRAVKSSFLHDEFVVYDVRQVRLRFLLELTVK